VIQWK